MGSRLVVVASPGFDERAGFGASSKPLHAEAFVTQPAIEALVRPVLSGLSWSDGHRFDVRLRKPAEDRDGDKLRTVIGAQILWRPVDAHESCEVVDDA